MVEKTPVNFTIAFQHIKNKAQLKKGLTVKITFDLILGVAQKLTP